MTAVSLPLPGQVLFTEDEGALLAMVAQGLTAEQIGQRAYLAERTTQKRLKALRAKVGASEREQLVTEALHVSAAPLVEVLQAIADRIAVDHGDTARITAARRAQLLADLDRRQADRGTRCRNPRATAALLTAALRDVAAPHPPTPAP